MKGRVQERTEEEIKRGRREREFTQAKVSICENYKVDKNSPPNGMCYVRREGKKKKEAGTRKMDSWTKKAPA